MHFLSPSVVRAAVVPGVILYPSFSFLPLLPLSLCWCVLAFGAGCVGWVLPLWCVRLRVGPAVCSVRAGSFFFLVVFFCFFRGSLSCGFSFSCRWLVLFLSLFLLSWSFGPVLRCGRLPWTHGESDVDKSNSHEHNEES